MRVFSLLGKTDTALDNPKACDGRRANGRHWRSRRVSPRMRRRISRSTAVQRLQRFSSRFIRRSAQQS
ncbi:MAG TPA: hypothetical protein VMS04_09395 [Vicinamibacterales bacterium]|nr:hypothetical protein [Vicinamibacterales bacterium]